MEKYRKMIGSKTIDNRSNAEYSTKSDKNLMTWGAVVRDKNKRGLHKEIDTYNVRFNPKLFNITMESHWDMDRYHIDPNATIVKILCETIKEFEKAKILGLKIDDDYEKLVVYADAPRYGASRKFEFTDENVAIVFRDVVLTKLINTKKKVRK
jgi:hypothetical protein